MTTALTPTARRGTLALGDVFQGSFATYRARFGLFLALLAAPIAIVFGVLILAGIASVAIAMSTAARGGPTPGQVGGFVAVGVVTVVGLFLASLYQYRCLAMTSLAALDLAEGRNPTWADLTRRTSGFMGRILLLLVAGFAAVVVLYTLILLITVAPLAMSGRTPSNAQIAGTITTVILLSLLLSVGAVWLTVKWLYVIPVMAAENRSGFAALGRSWALTRGDFWRTLGYYIVLQVVVAIPVFLLQFVGQVLLLPLAALSSGSGTPSGAQVTAMGIGALIYGLLTAAVTILITPFSTIFIALMYLSRVRQLNGEPPSVAYYQQPIGGYQQSGAPPVPGAYPQPGGYQQPGATPPVSPFGQPTSAAYPATPSYGPPATPASPTPQAWPPATPPATPPASAPDADDEGPTARQ